MFSSIRRVVKPAISIRCVADSVVTRCEAKLQKSLNPIQLKVRSSNEDPNGSHVCFFLLKYYIYFN